MLQTTLEWAAALALFSVLCWLSETWLRARHERLSLFCTYLFVFYAGLCLVGLIGAVWRWTS